MARSWRLATVAAVALALPVAAAAEVPLPRLSPKADAVPAASIAPRGETFEAMAVPATIEAAIEAEVSTDVWLAVARYYAMRDYAPVWTEARAATLRARLAEAAYDGLDPEAYAVADYGDGIAERAREDVALTEAALRYARHAHSGRIAPTDVSRIMTMDPPKLRELRFLVRLGRAEDVVKTLESVHPQHAQYQRLRAALRKTLDSSVPQPPAVGDGPALKVGSSGPRVAILRARVGATVRRGADPEVFDQDLAVAVATWQRANGLGADGIVGPNTLRVLDGASEAEQAEALISNMERWRWMPRWLGNHHVFVNVPAYRVEVVDGGEATYTGRVVVGTPSNPTPIFSDEIEHIVVNPYWNVPYSIAKNEMLGGIRSNPAGYMAKRNYEVVFNGRVVNPATVNWNEATLRRVRIRERPGRGNALGAVKFLFPNQHAVYLHDTPSKHLFSRDRRAYSHGCVRVENPFEFAAALLSREPNLSGPGIERMVGGGEKWLNTQEHIPVHLAYFTREVTAAGNVVRLDDVYGFDSRTQRKLGL
ncbi:murein L,D-transpeptidase [Acuticoccus sp. I52.16.1]|uniref:L,D-transpeptidase family protein n=1 Tax=Acuticoccus sp. I52.16.1 TaxID=2928472 RepID=UPI001FD1DB6F|nr:L,D-transpeptidase family protein [Acuticoccus sp. I52.16.1]UOM35931.1 L,D-transpeptidase family protein [Acuticoccus sp. I52.16.1]